MARAIDWTHYDTLKAQGLSDREIARRFEIPWTSFYREKQRYTATHPRTPALQRWHTPVHPGTLDRKPTRVHRGTPTLPAQQPTPVHRSTPLSNEVAVRLLSLLPDLEVMVVPEHDRQRLLSTPISTPRHTTKKTYVVDTLYCRFCGRELTAWPPAAGVDGKRDWLGHRSSATTDRYLKSDNRERLAYAQTMGEQLFKQVA
jgi:hypothetical protein